MPPLYQHTRMHALPYARLYTPFLIRDVFVLRFSELNSKGQEKAFATNFLGHFHLLNRLMEERVFGAPCIFEYASVIAHHC